MVPTEQENDWVPEQVWTMWGGIFVSARNVRRINP